MLCRTKLNLTKTEKKNKAQLQVLSKFHHLKVRYFTRLDNAYEMLYGASIFHTVFHPFESNFGPPLVVE